MPDVAHTLVAEKIDTLFVSCGYQPIHRSIVDTHIIRERRNIVELQRAGYPIPALHDHLDYYAQLMATYLITVAYSENQLTELSDDH